MRPEADEETGFASRGLDTLAAARKHPRESDIPPRIDQPVKRTRTAAPTDDPPLPKTKQLTPTPTSMITAVEPTPAAVTGGKVPVSVTANVRATVPVPTEATNGGAEEGTINLTPKLMWSAKEPSAMSKFIRHVNAKHNLAIKSYDQLHAWSVRDISSFWAAVWDFTNVIASQPYTRVYEEDVRMDKIPKWFIGARLNFAENLLAHRDDHLAIITANENGVGERLSYRELSDHVRLYSSALRSLGVKAGDTIAAYIANCTEAVALMLAVASVGAIWTSTSPDLGPAGVLERVGQIKPKLLFSVNAVVYNGKVHDHIPKLKAVVAGLPTLTRTIVLPLVKCELELSSIPNAESLADFTKRADPSDPLVFEQLPFNHPLFILYSSGTTGKPKCIVHSAGGALLQHKKEHMIHGGLTRTDVFFQYSTTSWMMWQWLVSGLTVGLTLVLYDGSPFKASTARLWDLVDELGITAFGTSAKYLQSCQDFELCPRRTHRLSTLRHIYSTGSPLHPEQYDYIYENIKEDVMVGSITGGTDIISLFAGHNCEGSVYRGEIMCKCLGMAIEAWGDDGKPVPAGTAGDLVCVKPFPVMPVFFWNDEDGEKYRGAYFAQFEGVWYHGDYMVVNPNTGGVVMLGRSDGTLKPAGVRFGSAELYTVVTPFKEIADSLAVGQKYNHDERVVMFLKMADGYKFTQELVGRVKAKIRDELSPRHVPAVILPIADIPHTLTGKKVEIAVKKIINGQKVAPSGALSNPESLELYYNIPDLK